MGVPGDSLTPGPGAALGSRLGRAPAVRAEPIMRRRYFVINSRKQSSERRKRNEDPEEMTREDVSLTDDESSS